MSTTKRRIALAAGIAAVAVAGTAGLSSAALFSDSKDLNGDFTAGTVTLTADAPAAGWTINATSFAPGDVNYLPVTVSNTGSLELRYNVSETVNSDATPVNALANPFSAQLTVATYDVTGLTCDAAGIVGLTALNATGTLASTAFDASQVLIASASQDLCFVVGAPQALSNDYQGASSNVTVTFAGEQTANN